MRIRHLILPILALATSSCGLVGVQGSGNVVTESREVTGFNEIVLDGSALVTVEVTGAESLIVEAEDNIIPLLDTEVRNGQLHLGARSSISPSVQIIYTITAAGIDGVRISGSGEMTVAGVDSTDFTVEISGSGDLVATGDIDGRLDVSISGSGSFDGEDLNSPEGQVEISGSGSALVNVTDALDVSVSGSGDVEYLGSPSIVVDTSGSGTVTQRD